MDFCLSALDLVELKKIQRNVVGTPSYVKVTCVLMFGQGLSVQVISNSLGIDASTAYRYLNTYTSSGIEPLLGTEHKGYWGMLESHQLSVLREELKTHVYTDAKIVSKWVASTFGVVYTAQGLVDLLNRIGFTYKKTKEVPCEADAEKQQQFAQELSVILQQKDASSVVYYADGVHPTHNSRSTYAWIEKGCELEQPTVSGRDRVNINGLLNAYDVTDVIALDQERINAQSTKELYQEALEKHPEAACIYIISDNARYYRNKELTQWVNASG